MILSSLNYNTHYITEKNIKGLFISSAQSCAYIAFLSSDLCGFQSVFHKDTHTHTHTHPTPTPVHPKPCAVKVETLTDSCLQDPLFISTREEQHFASGEYFCSSITDAVHMTAFLLKHGIICKCYALRRLPGDFGDSVFLAKKWNTRLDKGQIL